MNENAYRVTISKSYRDTTFVHPRLGKITNYEWVYQFQWDNRDGTSDAETFIYPLWNWNGDPVSRKPLDNYREMLVGWTCEEISKDERVYTNPLCQNSLVS